MQYCLFLSWTDPLTQEAQIFLPFICVESLIFYQNYTVQSSHSTHRFVLRSFANWQGQPKKKSTSLSPLSREEHQNCSTNQTGFWAIPHGVPSGNGVGGAVSITVFLQRRNTRSTTVLLGGCIYLQILLPMEVLKTNPCEKQRMSEISATVN